VQRAALCGVDQAVKAVFDPDDLPAVFIDCGFDCGADDGIQTWAIAASGAYTNTFDRTHSKFGF
jgi:hypothetical protein